MIKATWRSAAPERRLAMAQVTSGAETWVPHTHRHHHSGGTEWLFGPDGPSNVTGNDPQIAPAQIGDYGFLFWAAAGTTSGDLTYDAGQTTVSPSFPAGGDPASVIAWYAGTGGVNGGPPALVFDAFSATADDWLDWDGTNDPFTVTSGDRQPGPDDDDEAVTSNAAAVVTAMGHFPGTGLVFDHWLVFDTQHQHVTAWDIEQLTQDEGTSGYAIAVYVDPSRNWHIPDVPRAYDPWWWLKNSPVEGLQQLMRQQGEAAQIASLIDSSTAITSPRARSMVQHGLYEALLKVVEQQLHETSISEKEGVATR
jgi:hypothetical protein